MQKHMLKVLFATTAFAMAGNAVAFELELECNESGLVPSEDYLVCWHVQLKCEKASEALLVFDTGNAYAGVAGWLVTGFCEGEESFTATKQVTRKCLAAQGGMKAEFEAKAEPGDCPNL